MNINFSYYDIYSKQIGFFFNKNDRIGTNFGLVLTIIYIFVSLLLLIIYSFYTIKRINMKVYDSTTYPQDIPSLNISPKTLYFAFGLKDPKTSNRFIDESIYYPTLLFFDTMKVNGEFITTKRVELDYEPCKEEKFGEEYNHLISSGDLSNSYCLKDFNLTLLGGYRFNRFSYLRIILYPCVNKTENNNHCKPQDIIDYYLKGGYFSMIAKDIELNPDNFSEPVIYTLQNLYTTIDKSIYKDYIIYYGITEVKTDIGLFYQILETKKFLQFRKDVQFFYFRNESEYYEGKAICSIDFRLDELIYTQKRTYSKLHENFSVIGGYMHLASTIFTMLSFFANRIIPELKILNGIFNYNLKEKKLILKVRSIKDLDLKNSSRYLYFPPLSSKKQESEANNKTQSNINENSGNNILEIAKNISPSIEPNNKRKKSLFIQIKEREKENDKSNVEILNNTNIPLCENKRKSACNKNIIINKNYIYRVGSFYPKFKKSSEEKDKDSSLKDNVHKINFNIFDFYCLKKWTKRKKDIDMYNIGLILYKKRMDIIKVFTFFMLTEKKYLPSE